MKTIVTAVKTLLLVLITPFFTECNKAPISDFEFGQSTYFIGDVVKLKNKSMVQKDNTYKWTLPDGQTSTSVNVDYQLQPNVAPGTYNVKLEAFSKKGDKVSTVEKTFEVKPNTGQLTIWTSSNTGVIQVSVDNVVVGNITRYYFSSPGCGGSGCVTVTLSDGYHSLTAFNSTYTWSTLVQVTKGVCTPFQLK